MTCQLSISSHQFGAYRKQP